MTSLLLLAVLAADRPNVLFIAVDDMRVELGCYGQSHIVSPNIDRLAAAGTRFDRAYCQQAVCNPSRASVLTGLRPTTLGIYDLHTHFREVRPNIVTLPQAFKNAGYHTRNIGKMFHNWVQDSRRGDARSWSVPAVMHYFNHGDDVAHVGWVPESAVDNPKCERLDVPDEAYLDGRVAMLAADAITEYGRRADSPDARPFFLAVGFWKPHSPFNAPDKYWALYDEAAIEPPRPAERPDAVPEIALHDSREIFRAFKSRPGKRPTTADELTMRHGYYAAISYVDAQIGRVIDALDGAGLRDDTIVVFWSDHGYHLGEKTLWAKTSNFELDARVPLLIDVPRAADGQVSEQVVELLDLFPTLCDLCDVPPPDGLEGDSLKGLLLGESSRQTGDVAFTVHPRPAYVRDGEQPSVMGLSVRDSRWRYTEWRTYAGGAVTDEVVAAELYDHRDDHDETVNVADDAAYAETRARLRETLSRHLP